MTKRTPEYRDLLIFEKPNAQMWRDRRDGASALVFNPLDGATRSDLTRLFRLARANGFIVDRKHPLIVYGTVCAVSESETFRFEQLTSRQLADMDEAIYEATHA